VLVETKKLCCNRPTIYVPWRQEGLSGSCGRCKKTQEGVLAAGGRPARLHRRRGLSGGSRNPAAPTPHGCRRRCTSPAQDREIFNFALLLEYLQAAFYTEAVEQGALRGEVRRFAEVVSGHERAHVAYLRMALGRPRTPAPDVRLRRRPGRKPQSPDALRRTRRRSPGEQDSTCRASVSWCQAPTGSVLGVRLAARPDARSRCFRNGTAGERGRLERC
jgi:hypothetical protein